MNQYTLKELFEYIDGELYWKVNKGNVLAGKKAGSKRSDGYKTIRIDRQGYLSHRLIFLYHHGYLPLEVDHINGNLSDNRIENLIPSTHIESQQTRKIPFNNKTKNAGVVWHKATNKWQVRLNFYGVRKYFGIYKDIDYAIFVANAMRYKYHKQFSYNGKI